MSDTSHDRATKTREPISNTHISTDPIQQAKVAAGRATKKTFFFIKSGAKAIEAVRVATKAHADAKEAADALRKKLEDAQEELSYRQDVESRFSAIVEEQELAQKRAEHEIVRLDATMQELQTEKDQLTAELQALKQAHAESLRPYRELMESSKGRYDDAARSLSELKRAVKLADQQVVEAVRKREMRIAQANRNVDSAQERFSRTESELAVLQDSQKASSSAVAKLQSELVAEQAHLDAALADVKRQESEAQRVVQNAQTHLWTQKQSLEVQQRHAEECKAKAEEHRKEYETLYKRAEDEEKSLNERIAQRMKELEAKEAEKREQTELRDAAAAILQEAKDIHATPEKTRALSESIAYDSEDLQKKEAEEARLAKREEQVKKATRRIRLSFICAVAAVALIVILLVVLLFLPK